MKLVTISRAWHENTLFEENVFFHSFLVLFCGDLLKINQPEELDYSSRMKNVFVEDGNELIERECNLINFISSISAQPWQNSLVAKDL